jgi:serine/threonine protein phosphatase PrpC
MTSNINAFQYFGISVRGPRNIKTKHPNQDAWMGWSNQNASVITVCDGLGSLDKSHVGAREACLAVRDSVRIWAISHDDRVENLLRLIKQLWEIRLAPQSTHEYATTCLFAAMLPNQGLLVAGLGDGIAMVAQPKQPLDFIVERNSEFTNQTMALGTPHKLTDWRYKLYSRPPDIISILIATDGVADDLRPDRLSEFPDWILNTYGPLAAAQRHVALKNELKNWSTPGHQDDKSLALLYRK